VALPQAHVTDPGQGLGLRIPVTDLTTQCDRLAGLGDWIDLRLGPALETIGSFPAEPRFDLAFIDADKDGYPAYWLELVPRMRPGGLVLADNAFWGGEVVGFARDGRVMYVRQFNDLAAADPRVDLALTRSPTGS
jgi:caffeoyl-CoA O-methyltransferase